jgi:polar amino acid transport system substrate-binding protein
MSGVPLLAGLRGAVLAAGMLAAMPAAATPGPPVNACSKVISMSTGDWPPYNYHDEQGRHRGLDIELVRAVFKEAGCLLAEASPLPQPRNTVMFELARVDMMSGASKTPEREAQAWFSVRYRQEVVSLFTLEDRAGRYLGVDSFEALMRAGLSVLAPRIGYYGPGYERHMPALKSGGRLFLFPSFEQGMSMLAAGRADAILGDIESVNLAAVRQNVRVRALPFTALDAPVYMMFNKQSVPEADVRRIDAAVGRLEKRGVLEKIRRAYVAS